MVPHLFGCVVLRYTSHIPYSAVHRFPIHQIHQPRPIQKNNTPFRSTRRRVARVRSTAPPRLQRIRANLRRITKGVGAGLSTRIARHARPAERRYARSPDPPPMIGVPLPVGGGWDTRRELLRMSRLGWATGDAYRRRHRRLISGGSDAFAVQVQRRAPAALRIRRKRASAGVAGGDAARYSLRTRSRKC
jgi:hypothetical protein